jgi:hypothetical protein
MFNSGWLAGPECYSWLDGLEHLDDVYPRWQNWWWVPHACSCV